MTSTAKSVHLASFLSESTYSIEEVTKTGQKTTALAGVTAAVVALTLSHRAGR